jgi:hypothetical protein
MRIFKDRRFDRFVSDEGISDKQLKDAVGEIEAGLVEADLGGHVFKKRLARAGEGKSGGYRAIVFFKSGERTFFHYGFPKSRRDNITKLELKSSKKTAKELFKLSDKQLDALVEAGYYIEIGERS